MEVVMSIVPQDPAWFVLWLVSGIAVLYGIIGTVRHLIIKRRKK
jgi:hypothetical protein